MLLYDRERGDYMQQTPVLDYIVCLPLEQSEFLSSKDLQVMELRKKFKDAVLKVILRNRDKSANEKPKIQYLIRNIKEQLAREDESSDEEGATKKLFPLSKKYFAKNLVQNFL